MHLRRPPAWSAILTVLLLLVAGWSALPAGLPRNLGVVAFNAVVVAVMAAGTVRLRPAPLALWWALVAGQAVNTLAWASWIVLPAVGVDLPTPNIGDAFFLTSYVLSVVVVARLARVSGADRSLAADAVSLGISFAVVLWVTIAAPQAHAPHVSPLAVIVAISYPMLDALLLAAVAPLVLAGTRTPRALLLAGWVVLQLAGDVVYGRQVVNGTFAMGTHVFLLWLAGYALLAGAAVHPSGTLTSGRSLWWRRGVLAGGVLPLPGLLVVRAVQGSARDVALIAGASVVVTLISVVPVVAQKGDLPASAEKAVRRSLLRLSAALLIVAMLPLAGLTWIAVSSSRGALERELDRRLTAAATISSSQVAGQVSTLETLVDSYAERPGLVTAVEAHRYDVVVEHLANLESRNPAYAGAFFVDADGVMRALSPAQPALLGLDFSYRDYFRGVVRTRRPFVSEAYTTALAGRPQAVSVAAPVQRAGTFLGALVVPLRLDALQAFVGRLGELQQAEVTMTDRNGVVIAGAGAGVGSGPLRRISGQSEVRDALAGHSGLVRPPSHSRGSWRSYAPVHPLGWSVIADVPARTAYAGLDALTGRVLAVATLLGQVLLLGLLLYVRGERRRRAAEAQVWVREQQVSEILDAAGDAFVSVDEAGTTAAWNRQAERIFGWTREEALGQPLAELVVPPELRDAHALGIGQAQNGLRSDRTLQVEARRQDGTTFPAEVTVWGAVADGTRTFHAFVRDISLRKEQEIALATARDEALRGSRMKSEFVANMSHEIRTPMNGVVGMTTLLLHTSLDDRQREYVETLRVSADALLTVINDVLDFSKIEAGKVDIEHLDFGVTALVEDVVELLAASARVKDIVIAAVVDPILPLTLRGDAHRLRQVLTNLVGNAVKFTERGEVVVEVVAEGPVVDGRVPIRFDVRDTGAGISADRREQLFDAFTQADATTTRRHGGTGLGLTISRRLTQLMGGDLTVDSRLGHGSTFSARLVLDVGVQPAGAPPADLAGVRILVADDRVTNRTVLEHLLDRWSADVVSVGDGLAALSLLRSAAKDGRPFRVALLDVRMPGLDGPGVARAVAEDPVLSDTRIVLLSSSDEPEEVGVRGVDARMTKPVRERQLHRVVLEQLRGRMAPEVPLPVPCEPEQLVSRGCVLVAEDNVVNQLVIVEMLRILGFTSDVAADGAEAVDRVRTRAYDVVLMDCQMPNVDGLEATQQIRALDLPQATVPVVALTASALQSDREACERAGMEGFLPKPLRLEELQEVLDRIVVRV